MGMGIPRSQSKIGMMSLLSASSTVQCELVRIVPDFTDPQPAEGKPFVTLLVPFYPSDRVHPKSLERHCSSHEVDRSLIRQLGAFAGPGRYRR